MPYALKYPTYAGQGPNHAENFELVFEVLGESEVMLVAISLERDVKGRYRVRSTYLIKRSKVRARIANGRLRRVDTL